WTRSLKPVHLSTLTGDRVNLPSECLESITRDSNHSHPLTFQLIRALPSQQDQQPQQQQQKATVFASVREFTAPPGIIQIGPLLAEALGLANLTSLESPDAMTEEPIPDVDSYILVTIEQLPPGVHAKLTPLDSTYLEITDMRATLETHLRKHHATLTKGLTLHVTEISRTSRRAIEHRFLVSELHAADNDNPVPGCIILDQDVTVDIEPLDRSAAEEAVRNKYAIRATPECTLAWGSNDDRGQASTKGVVEPNQHVYFQLPAQPGVCEYTVQLEPLTGDADLFLSTILEHPTLLDHTHFNVESGLSTISLQIDHEVSPILYIGVLGSTDGEGALPSQFEICVRSSPSSSTSSSAPAMDAPDELTGETIQCENCKTSIRAATYQLHLAFCLRHNILCSQCHRAFPKSAIDAHWHCSFC
ncbi:ubiquitin fusion degradation protein UFD1-domain-containing protein, partial [Powellomyces hirtus]